MVKLKNIKKMDCLVECDIFPEDSLCAGHIVVDLKTGEMKEYFLPEGYEWCVNHVCHAQRSLVELVAGANIPEEYLVMWY